MSNEEWWEKIKKTYNHENAKWILGDALREVVELHKPYAGSLNDVPTTRCTECGFAYPCPTNQVVEKVLA